MVKDTQDFLGRHKNLAALAAFALLGLISWLDYNTGVEVSFSIFYLVPVSLVAWSSGLVNGLAMSVVSAVVWMLMDHVIGGRVYTSPTVAYWNSLVRFGFFTVTAVSLAVIRRMLGRERESSRLKSDMVSMVSHEFNNSLITLNLVSTLLREYDGEAVTEERRKLYAILENTSRNLNQMIKNFLNKARLEAGKFVLDVQPTELRKIVCGVVDTASPLSEAKGITVSTNFPEGVIPVKCDPDAIALVMNNLIGNALKYTPQKGRVAVTIAPVEGSKNRVRISVEDTGIGIEKNDAKAIFSGFYRADGGKSSGKGFGIGLKVARDLVEAHGSRIFVESAPGRGSKFTFELPVWEEAAGN
ncbi:MAG: HAMP domain-containing sensor histidine kinase [Elusimicrobiales bacterium]|nr:HAMP domain-containing sensor histidine kinase [Elusimicrobiales bacterium]